MAQAVLALYDTSKDGRLDSQEARKCPSLADGFEFLDKNKDRYVDEEELTSAISTLTVGNVALVPENLLITRGGQGAGGIKVRLVPESFMAGSVKEAAGISNANGIVSFQVEGITHSTGASPGFYRVELSQKDGDGPEKLPAMYNSQSVFGRLIRSERSERWEIRLGS